MSKIVYLSGPITGLTYQDARYGWRSIFAKLLDIDITVLSPMRHEGHLAEMKGKSIQPDNLPDGLFSQSKMIVTKDFLDIRSSDIMVVNFLEATRVSEGTLIELGYAAAMGVTIIIIQQPAPTNVHRSPFLGELGIVVNTLEEAATIVNSLLSEGV